MFRTPACLVLLLLMPSLISCVVARPLSDYPPAELPPPISSDDSGYRDPGWLDLGVGVGVGFNTVHENDNDVLGALVAIKGYPFGRWYLIDRDGYVREVAGRTDLIHRTSILYGLSIGEFTGSDIRGPMHVLGLGFDIAPQLMLVSGVSLFEEKRNAGNDTDFAFYLGFALNLHSILSFGGGDTPVEPDPNGERDPRF